MQSAECNNTVIKNKNINKNFFFIFTEFFGIIAEIISEIFNFAFEVIFFKKSDFIYKLYADIT